MVSRNDAPVTADDSSAEAVLLPACPGFYVVMVPVFLRVVVPAEDDLDAEVAAVGLVRSLGRLAVGQATVEIRSVIAPLVTPVTVKEA